MTFSLLVVTCYYLLFFLQCLNSMTRPYELVTHFVADGRCDDEHGTPEELQWRNAECKPVVISFTREALVVDMKLPIIDVPMTGVRDIRSIEPIPDRFLPFELPFQSICGIKISSQSLSIIGLFTVDINARIRITVPDQNSGDMLHVHSNTYSWVAAKTNSTSSIPNVRLFRLFIPLIVLSVYCLTNKTYRSRLLTTLRTLCFRR